MDSRTVRYGRIGEVVVMIFPDEQGSKHFITRLETQNLLGKIGNNTPIAPLKPSIIPNLKPRNVV
jgi:hypothetical protein